MMSNQKIAKLEAALEYLSERVADLQNPMLYNVGDKVRAVGKNSLSHISYEGDIIDSHFVYKKYDTSVPDFSGAQRINSYKILTATNLIRLNCCSNYVFEDSVKNL
jgi:hypothetical protein